MRLRNGLVLALATAMLMCMSGTALAVTGMAGNGSAGIAQYGDGSDVPTGDDGGGAPGNDRGSVLGGPNPSGGSPDRVSQANVAQDIDTQLPFTGFVLIPLLLGGVALLAGGLVLRGQVSATRPA